MSDTDEMRDKAEAHSEEIALRSWLTPAELAARWHISLSSVYAIPAEELKYKQFGQGKKRPRRRYKPDWVHAYEERAA